MNTEKLKELSEFLKENPKLDARLKDLMIDVCTDIFAECKIYPSSDVRKKVSLLLLKFAWESTEILDKSKSI